jgi:hypothetical protein
MTAWAIAITIILLLAARPLCMLVIALFDWTQREK